MKVVIFDCDGVLIDSEILADRVVLEYCADCFPEIDFSPWQAQMTGVMTRDIINSMEAKLAIQFPADADQAILQRLDETLHEQIQPIEGIAQALAAINKPKAVVSNSDSGHVRRMLIRTGIIEHFNEQIFGADQVERPKPHPDLYLHAAENLGVKPTDCIVIEDSVTGATAALSAAMSVIGFIGGGHATAVHGDRLRELGIEHVIDNMAQLPAKLASLNV